MVRINQGCCVNSAIIQDDTVSEGCRVDLRADDISFQKKGGILSLTSPDENEYNDGNKILHIPYKNGMLATTEDIPQIQVGANVTIDKTDPAKPVISAIGAGGETRLTKEVLWTVSDFDLFNGGNIQKTHNLNIRYVVKAEWLKANRGQANGSNARVDIYTETMKYAGYVTFGYIDFAAYIMEFGSNDAIYIEYIEDTDLGSS